MAGKKDKKTKYYRLDRILDLNCQYNLIIGERSNGKTYAILEHCIKQYFSCGFQFAVIRRWQEDFKSKRAASMFDSLIQNGVIERASEGQWTGVYYVSGRWYLSRMEDDKRITSPEPMAFAFSINNMEHDKGTGYTQNVYNIFFDEFLTRELYLPNEFILYCNVLSSIIRDRRENIHIFMAANTVSKFSPYWNEFGITKIVKDMSPGDLEIVKYGDSGLTMAIEFSDSGGQGKASDVFFAFNNPQLQMITSGAWEMEIYPHLPQRYKPKNIIKTFFIQYDGECLQCEIIRIDKLLFTYIHRKTTPIQNPDRDIVFTPDADPRPNYNKRITKPLSPMHKKCAEYFNDDLIYYQDNEVGEIVRSYLQWCG